MAAVIIFQLVARCDPLKRAPSRPHFRNACGYAGDAALKGGEPDP